MKTLNLDGMSFSRQFTSAQIDKAVRRIARQMNNDFENLEVIFLSVLNGAFMFTADLLKLIAFRNQISFIKISSYQGTNQGELKEIIGLDLTIKSKIVIILEDIVDTGNTIEQIITMLEPEEPAEIRIATLLHKPDAYRKNIPLHYVGFEIPDRFIIGYGLDYDGIGRNMPDLYIMS